jgi:hypothetical protein
MMSESKPTGRPSKYTTEIAAEILTRLSEGESLRTIVKDKHMPAQSTVYEWLLAKPDFAEHYARAREEQADTLADEIVAIADETPDLNPVLDKDGQLIRMELHSAYIQWQKNRVDARKWVAAKLKPKKYSEKQILSNDPESPVSIGVNLDFFKELAAKVEGEKRK